MASEAELEQRPWRIPSSLHGQRLDRALSELVPEFSRSYLQQLIEAGAVSSGQEPTRLLLRKPAHKVRAGDSGVIELRPTPQSQAFKPEVMALDIVHEDAHLLVIHKPAGLVVHPAPGNWSGTLLNGLLGRDQGRGEAAAQLPRAGIVHRLDKDTSGLMVVARTRVAMEALARMIAAREVSRQYLALAHRAWAGPARRDVGGAPQEGIGRDPAHRLRMAVVDLTRHPGKPARTTFELLRNAAPTPELAQGACLLRCTLHTGRTHQIRVHAASIGHPLISDSLYGGAPAGGLQRQALHAWRLALRHPVSGEALVFHAPPPSDLRDACAALGLDYNAAQETPNSPLP
ncbi:pseudouridine synthase [Hylemonella gracilis str. Niagara R]|uniref:Pseudouridine synthase n=1 Tax=Hylemonella gracilis str. Niagara R TaxID=1458275 RepID=A0A016XI50_9BURK|nr:RluA family pseudouridine synthase [Hylemonella gracilis]EYC51242.1 pseudouridine synthase [Hylemonella gracilis str. Niagara R]